MEKEKNAAQSSSVFDLLRDIRVIRIIAQIVFMVVVVIALATIWTNILNTLRASNLLPTFEFLERRAGFAINQAPEWYTSTTGTYAEAFLVGVVNTLTIVILGLVAATILGVLLGVFLLSDNWLIKTISRAYVEVLRNTPLLVQLIFWFFVVMLSLPEQDITLPNEGIFILWLRYFSYLFTLIGVWLYSVRVADAPPRLINGVLTGILGAEIIFWILGGDSWLAIIGIAVIGALVYSVSTRKNIVPGMYEGLAKGVGILALAQLAGHIITLLLAQTGAIPHPQLVYEPLMPSIFISRRGLVIPALLTNQRFGLFAGFAAAGLGFGWMITNLLDEYAGQTGRVIPAGFIGTGVFILMGAIGWFAAGLSAPPMLELGGIQQTINVGVPTFRISVFLLLIYGLIAASALWRSYKATATGRGRNWTPLVLSGIVFAVVTLLLLRIFVPLGDTPGYITNFFWNTQIRLQRETLNFPVFLIGTIISLLLGAGIWLWMRNLRMRGYEIPAAVYGILTAVLLILISFGYSNLPEPATLEIEGEVVTLAEAREQDLLEPEEFIEYSDDPFEIVNPELNRFGRLEIGTSLGPSYLALLFGLVVYTSAFIGEIVRAGIQAVPYGQIEASRALGLSQAQTLRMIILPQALRVILPPMGNQYLNLAKNSSLALAIGYADTYQVGNTIMNQSGQSITGFALILAVYLTMSLVISFVMNNVNSRFQLVTR